jgi:hypothetical protein
MAIESNLILLITMLVIVVVGVLLLYLIDWFVWNLRLANALKTLVALICLAAMLQRLLPLLWAGF